MQAKSPLSLGSGSVGGGGVCVGGRRTKKRRDVQILSSIGLPEVQNTQPSGTGCAGNHSSVTQVINTGNCCNVANYYLPVIGLETDPLCVKSTCPHLPPGQLVCEIQALAWLLCTGRTSEQVECRDGVSCSPILFQAMGRSPACKPMGSCDGQPAGPPRCVFLLSRS